MNITFFITHKTLGVEHLDCCFKSLSNQSLLSAPIFDKLYIYNTHEDELSNELILEYYYLYCLDRMFGGVEIFPYDSNTHKSLGADVNAIKEFCLNNFDGQDRVLILKSDCLLSKNYFKTILSTNQRVRGNVYFVAPFICAKQRVPNDEIFQYLNRDKVVFSDDITFFVEDQYQSINTDFNNRDIDILSEQIKFTSCYVIRDFSCHYFNVGLFPNITIQYQSWGGVNFSELIPHFVRTEDCFVIHKYHSILSENRNTDREGPVKAWLES
jgi:hypothetical protein